MSLKLVDVWYKYPGDNRWVLKGVSYEFRIGMIYVVLGPNGSGKTTLLKTASLLYRPLKGRILTWDMDYWNLPRDKRLVVRRRIIYVHEKPILLRGTTTLNIAYGLIIRGVDKGEALERARRLLSDLGLDHLADKNVDELSMGEAQITSILRALITKPKLLFLDEPLNHIDIEKRETIIELLEKLKKNMGIIISTHDTYLAERIADETIIIKNGRITKTTTKPP